MDEFLKEVPMGFSMAIAKNMDAFKKFALLPEDKRKEIIDRTKYISSQQEMNMYVQDLVDSNFNR